MVRIGAATINGAGNKSITELHTITGLLLVVVVVVVVVDRFCIALFSTLEQTHCALLRCCLTGLIG